MNFSLNRNEFVAKKLGKLNGDRVLDIGCRDKIFKTYLLGKFEYSGIDYDPFNTDKFNNDQELINHNLEDGLPDIFEFEIINALDVLEHVENIHDLFQDIFKKSKKKISIALPNMGYYKFRLKFLFSGEISGKYIFHSKKIIDRHRWLPNYASIIAFINSNLPDGWSVKKFNYIAERK